jgi:heme exporter protein D
MNWNSPAEFFAMGGYGLYVWGSFGVTAVALLIEPILAQRRRNAILKSLRREFAAPEENA